MRSRKSGDKPYYQFDETMKKSVYHYPKVNYILRSTFGSKTYIIIKYKE